MTITTERGPTGSPVPDGPTEVAPPTVGSGSTGGVWSERVLRLVRGRPADPAWVRPAVLVLLALTAVLYLVDLGASGWANSFYAAAVQAGSTSWKAFFFGSSDASNFITVDKPPAALWVMDLSARAFGLNAWSLLVPQALEGVAAVGVLYVTVRRWLSPQAGLLAGAVLALTPVAALMFRFNNPDALLVLLLTLAAYATLRAVESSRTWWLVLAGSLVGLGFLTKMLQALVIVPVLAGVYLLAASPPWWRRVRQLCWAGVALVVAGGWWVAVVQLIPAADRPYIGGSQDNNLLNLIFGYNGFGRLTGNEAGSVGGGGQGTGRWGPTGLFRLFESDMGGQISWLIPAALVLLAAALWLTRRAPRTDLPRAVLVVFGGWLVLTGLLFSFSAGIIHPYYTVALAPAVGALVGAGAWILWSRRDQLFARLALGVAVAATAVWSFVLLDRTPTWYPGLRDVVLVGGLAAALALAVVPRGRGRLGIGVALAAVVLGLAAPAAYSIETAATPHRGAIPSAGPAVTAGFGAFPGGGGFGGFGGFGGGGGGGRPATAPGGAAPAGATRNGPGPGASGRPGGQGFGGGGGGAIGNLLNGSTPSAALTTLLDQGAAGYTWVAATVGSNSAAGYQLATDHPVMAIGGFNGTDPAPTLAQFTAWVAAGRIHYFIAGGTGAGSSDDASAITTWVEDHFTATTVGGTTVYDLTTPRSTTG